MNLKNLLSILLAIATAAVAAAEDLLPEIAPLAARHDADTETLTAQKNAAIVRAQKPYLMVLDSAEKTATSAAQLSAVAGISKEREAVANGTASAAFPTDLPKTLQADRRAYFDAIGRIVADAAPRQQRIDAEYLRGLAMVQPKAAANPALAAQIKSEKERMLSGVKPGSSTSPATNLTSAVSGTHGKDVLSQKIAGSKWTMYGKKDFTEQKRDVTIEAGGLGTWGESPTKWEAIDGKTIKFRYGTITFADDFKSFTYTEGKFTDYGKRHR